MISKETYIYCKQIERAAKAEERAAKERGDEAAAYRARQKWIKAAAIIVDYQNERRARAH